VLTVDISLLLVISWFVIVSLIRKSEFKVSVVKYYCG